MNQPLEPAGLLSRAFGVCFAANMLQGVAFNLFLHLPGHLHNLGASDLEIGWIAGLTAIAAILLRAPLGRAMDRRGRRPIILWGGVVNSVAVLGYLLVDSIGPLLYAVRILHGLAEAMLFTALFTYAADHVPSRTRTQGLALFGVSGMLPIALAGAIGDWLIPLRGYDAIFELALALAVCSWLLSLALPEHWAAHDGKEAGGGLRATITQRDLLSLWWIGAVFSVALTAFFVFIRRFVDETGIGSVGLFFTAYTVAALILRVGFGWLPDRVGPRRVLAPALAALAVGFLQMAAADSASDLVIAGVLCGVGHGYTFPILFAMVVSRASEARRGRAMAVYTALFDVGVLLGGPVFGAIVEGLGFSLMFATAGAFVAFGAVVFFVWDARVRRLMLQ